MEFMPRHVGIIMDGNGRWAKARHRPRVFGHHHGVDAVRHTVKAASEWGIQALTLYAFSDENWRRPLDEIGVIMSLLETYIRKELEELNRNNVSLRVIGEMDRLNPGVRDLLAEAMQRLSGNSGLVLTLALSYGSRMEITRAVRELARRVAKGEILPEDIDAGLFSQCLDTAGLPDPDLIIRTSGEQRLSNFMLWQAAYSELYFTAVHWPDFSREEFARAISTYGGRERRFGKTGDQVLAKTKASVGLDAAPC